MGSSCKAFQRQDEEKNEQDIQEKEGKIQKSKQMCTKIQKIGYLHEGLDEAQLWVGVKAQIFLLQKNEKEKKEINILTKTIEKQRLRSKGSYSSDSRCSSSSNKMSVEKHKQPRSLQNVQNNLQRPNTTLKPSSFRKIPRTSNQIDF